MVGGVDGGERGVRAAEALSAELVCAGFSLGGMTAQKLAARILRPGVRVGTAWPDGVPVQVHGADADPYFAGDDLEAARALVSEAKEGELFIYPGDRHLFADSSLPSYNPEAAALLTRRVLDFLAAR